MIAALSASRAVEDTLYFAVRIALVALSMNCWNLTCLSCLKEGVDSWPVLWRMHHVYCLAVK